MRSKLHSTRIIFLAAMLAACGSDVTGPKPEDKPVTPTDTVAPAPQREFRGMWIATVNNIDWPSRSGLTAAQQQAELNDLLDRAQRAGLNAIIFHVRPAGDAVYSSSIEPWGAMLSGTQGVDPGYDPLQYAIEQAHTRGLELHAWINPFRAGNSKDTLKLAATHLFNTHRNWLRIYGTQVWMDPGEPAVQDHSMRVIKDIVTRYDIDGLHADDYFYPYQENDASGKLIVFPDSATYAQYGGGMARDDWRRENINRFLQRMYEEVHAIKPSVKVGLSPFGIWRPGNPAGITGLDAWASIYADSKKWLNNGWLDYLAPQLYWSIASTGQSYPALLDWWIGQNTKGRHIWPGLAAYRVQDGSSSAFSSSEIQNQIGLTRNRAGSTGVILYNATWTLKQNAAALATSLANDLYKSAAIVPASPWLDATPPPAPTLTASSGSIQIVPGSGEAARWWVIRTHSTLTGWKTQQQYATSLTVFTGSSTDRVLVQAMDAAGNLSTVAEWKRTT